MVESKRIRLFNTDTFGVDIEYAPNMLIIHLPWLEVFNKKTYRDMVEALEKYSDLFRVIGQSKLYAAVDTNNTKIKKLLTKLKFTRIGISGDLDVYEKEN